MAARSKLVRATDGKKIAFINGTKYKSLKSSNHQAALVAEARAAAVMTDCIVSANKSAQNDSAATTVLIHANIVPFAAKKRRTVASTMKDEDVLNNLLNGHQECQLLTQQFITLAERELTVCLSPPPISPGYSPPASPKKKQVAGSTLAQSRVKAREQLRQAHTNDTPMNSNTTTNSKGTRTSPWHAVQNLQSLNEHAMAIGQQRSMSAKSVCRFKEVRPSKPRVAKTDSVQNYIGCSVSFNVTNKHCLYFFRPIQDRIKAASNPGLKKGSFPSDTVPNGYLKGTVMKRDKSSNVNSWEVAWNYTAFGNLKVFHPQVVENLDSSDDESNCSGTSELFVPSVASKERSTCLEGSHK
jgi:hypothetical protein